MRGEPDVDSHELSRSLDSSRRQSNDRNCSHTESHSHSKGSKSTNKFTRCCANLHKKPFVKALLAKENPVPEDPSILDKIKWYLRCPPHGNLGWILTRLVAFLIAVGCMYGLLGPDEAGPELYIFVLYMVSRMSGFIVSLIKLPPLLGMLLSGIVISNLNRYLDVVPPLDPYWKEVLRDISFITILIRAGLSLNPKGVLEMRQVVVLLAFCPGVVTEGPVVALITHFLLDLPFLWALMLGFILAAVSPAVVVPSLLGLQNKGFGVDQGIPTLIIAAASIDDIIAISAFSIVLSINFANQHSGIWIEILRAPLEVIIGVGAAFVVGAVMWYVPPQAKNELDKKCQPKENQKSHSLARFLMLFGCGILFMFGARKLHLSGAGALGTLCTAFFTGLGWDSKTKLPVGFAFGRAWNALMPLLFGLIGTEIDLKVLGDPTIILSAIGIITGGLVGRFTATFLAVSCAGLNIQERIFVAIAWIPKATVQAAMGTIPLDFARERLLVAQHHVQAAGNNTTPALLADLKTAEEHVGFGKIIITVAVVAILISAPIGAVGISLTGKKLLQPKRKVSRRLSKVGRKSSQVKRTDGNPRPLYIMCEEEQNSEADADEDKDITLPDDTQYKTIDASDTEC